MFNAQVGPALCFLLLAVPPLAGAGASLADAMDTASLVATALSLQAFMVMMAWIFYYLRKSINKSLAVLHAEEDEHSNARTQLRSARLSVVRVAMLVGALGPGALAVLVLMSFVPFFRQRMYLCVQLCVCGANAFHVLILVLMGRKGTAKLGRRVSTSTKFTSGRSTKRGGATTSATSKSSQSTQSSRSGANATASSAGNSGNSRDSSDDVATSVMVESGVGGSRGGETVASTWFNDDGASPPPSGGASVAPSSED